MVVKTENPRLRDMVKRLVIEVGYLENLANTDAENLYLRLAKSSLDFAADLINKHLAEEVEL